MASQLYPRYSKESIETALTDTPVIFIMGPRQCGKTTLVKSLMKKNGWQYINLDDAAQLAIAKSDPTAFVRNLFAKHIVLDEIQRAPELLISIKQAVDENRIPGKFLLTGSANALLQPQVSDSLAGRIESIPIYALSECEIQTIKPTFLSKLLSQIAPISKHTRIRDYLIKRIITGCFPEPLQRQSEKRIQVWYNQYVNSLIQKDIKEIDHVEHPEKALKLLKLSAHYSSQLVNFTEFGNQLNLDRGTIKKYLGLLQQLFLLHELPAWHTNFYKRLIKTPKLHLADTGLICALQNINHDYLLKNPQKIRALLETFVINELRKQASWLDENLSFYHYRDKDQSEVDCIIENSAGECFAIEIKAKATLVPSDFKGLHKFKEIAGKHFKIGILLYDGDHTTAFSENLFAVPIGALWS